MIAFIGSVFSPYYALAGRRDPQNHVVLNVALYEAGDDLWAMTERGRHALARTRDSLRIGPSALSWTGDAFSIAFDEVTVPRPPGNWLPRRLRGSVAFEAEAPPGPVTALDAGERHMWHPIAPRGRITIEVAEPRPLSWTGHGYLDRNWGLEPLEAGFERWDWARAHRDDGSTAILYDSQARDGSTRRVGLRFDPDGTLSRFGLPPAQSLKPGFWRMDRQVPCDDGETATVVRTLEDSPFYMRSLVDTVIGGVRSRYMQESLSGDRLASPVVKAMLPFRMPRRA